MKQSEFSGWCDRTNMASCVSSLLVFSTIIRAISGILSSPTNVTLSSRNLNLVLSWDPPDGAPSGLIYTTDFKSSVTDNKKGCENISTLQCDLSVFKISVYGTYTGRVRALLGPESSAWVESNKIILDKDTIIGPPSVSLLSNGVTLEVSIKEPEFSFSSLWETYDSASYTIVYWKKGQEHEKRIDIKQQNRVILDKTNGLEPWTEYCVQVHIDTNRSQNPSEPSSVVCESTTDEESPWVAAVVVFVIMAVIVSLVVVAVLNWSSISQFLYPNEALPEFLKETLLASPKSSMYLAMKNSEPVKEINHQVSVVAADQMVEGGGLSDAMESICNKQPNGILVDR